MTSKFFERRSLRNQLKTYLEAQGWTDLRWAEGFSQFELAEVIPPFIVIFIDDLGKDELEMGSDPTTNKLYSRRAQITVYMEGEDRVDAIADDISDFLDLDAIIITDNSSNVLGSMISDTSSIIATNVMPSLNEEENLDWQGHVSCIYEVHYPQG